MAHSFKSIIIAMLLLALLPTRGSGQGWELIRLSFGTGFEALPAIVAQERGFFVQEELIISGFASPTARVLAQSLASGTTDFAATDQRTLLLMAGAEVPVKVVAMSNWDTKLDLIIPAGSRDIRSIEDLETRTVAVASGSEAYPTLIRLLDQADLGPSDVNIQVLAATDVAAAIRENRAAAALAARPLTVELLGSGEARPLLSYDEIVGALGVVGAQPVVARQQLIEEEPDIVQRFLNAWVKGLVYIQQDPDDAASLLQIFMHRQGTAIAKDVARAWIDMTRYDRYSWSSRDIADTEYNAWALEKGNIFKQAPSLDGYVDNRFAEQAWADLQE